MFHRQVLQLEGECYSYNFTLGLWMFNHNGHHHNDIPAKCELH